MKMVKQRRCAQTLIISWAMLFAILDVGASARAGILTTHSFAAADAWAGGQHVYDYPGESPGFAFVGPIQAVETNPQSTYLGTAFAVGNTGPAFLNFLHAGASTFSNHELLEARSQVGVAWRDIAFVTRTQAPKFIRMDFEVEGQLKSFTPNGTASLSINATTAISQSEPFLGWGQPASAQVWSPGSGLTNEFVGWDDYLYLDIPPDVNGYFRGSFHIDVPYDQTIDAYYWGVAMNLQAYGLPRSSGPTGTIPAFSIADFTGSLGLLRVTDPDGNPIDVTFDSGLPLINSVPEPSSIALLSSGLLSAIALRRRRASSERK